MPIRILCPACRKAYTLDDALRGKKVLCPECKTALLIPAPKPLPVQLVEEGITERKRRTGAVQVAPPAADVEDKPRVRKQAPAVFPWLLVGGGVGALALVGAILVAIVVANSKATPPNPGPPPFVQNRVPPNVAFPDGRDLKAPMPQRPPEQADVPFPPEGKQPPPVLAGQLDRELLAKVKRATVHLRVFLPDGRVAQGSGFFGVEPGVVLTNAHVLGMLNPDSPRPRQVEVVADSGEAGSRKYDGEILGVDRSSDLAVLRVRGDRQPAPLEVRPAADLQETQQVFVFGFPFGDNLGTNITVSQSSVSSLRKSATGELLKVQVNGGMHPGNSGGPVVNGRGEVVGVAVSGIEATQINFAVPGEFVHVVLNGRITGLSFGQTRRDGDQRKVPFTLTILDPLGRMQQAALEVWAGHPGKSRPPSEAPPPLLPGDSPRLRVDLKPAGGVARGEVVLPDVEAGKVLWTQPSFVDGTGRARWVVAQTYVPAAPVDREAIALALRHQAGGRPVALNSRNSFKIIAPGRKPFDFDINMETKMAESMIGQDTRRGLAVIRMRYLRYEVGVPTKFAPARGSRAEQRLKHIVQQIGKLSANLVVDPTGKLVKNDVDLRRVPPDARADLEEMHGQMQESLEALAVPVPNRVVQPGESWQAKRSLLLVTGDKLQTAAMELVYTYEGLRLRDGRQEAVIAIRGAARGRDGRELQVGGKVTGGAYFDVAAGQFARAEVTAVVEIDLGDGIRAVGKQESKLERTLGTEVVNLRGALTAQDARDARGCYAKVHPIQMTAGKPCTISLESPAGKGFFDTYLRVEDGAGRVLAQDDDSGVDLNSLLVFRPERTDTYRVVVTSYAPNATGSYALIVRQQ